MGTKEDKLWSLHNHQRYGLVAAVDPPTSSSQPSATMAEVKTGQAAKGGHSGGQRGKGCACGGYCCSC